MTTAAEEASALLAGLDDKTRRMPTLMFSRKFADISDERRIRSVAALSQENIVFDVATAESPAVAENRMLLGTSAHSPPNNGRRVWKDSEFHLLQCNNGDATFIHRCLQFYGQAGKILQHETYQIRIGRFTVAESLLNVIRFNQFGNRGTYTAAEAPNTVAAGVFNVNIDRKKLLACAQSNDTDDFPGITYTPRSGAKCTPGLHTKKPSRFILPGTRSIYDLYAAVLEISEVALECEETPPEREKKKREKTSFEREKAECKKTPSECEETPLEDGGEADRGRAKRARIEGP